MLGAFILTAAVVAFVGGYATAYATQRLTDPHAVPVTGSIPITGRNDQA